MADYTNLGDFAKNVLSDNGNVARVVSGTRRLREWAMTAVQTYGNIVLGLNATGCDDSTVAKALPRYRDLESCAQQRKAGSSLPAHAGGSLGSGPRSG